MTESRIEQAIGTALDGVCSVSHTEHLVIIFLAQVVIQIMMMCSKTAFRWILFFRFHKLPTLVFNYLLGKIIYRATYKGDQNEKQSTLDYRD